MSYGVYPRFTHLLQDHKTHKTDRVIYLKLQTLLVDSLAKEHQQLFMGNVKFEIGTRESWSFVEMARHISASFRDEYIQAGQGYSSSSTETTTSNKRKELSFSDLETPSAKIAKSESSPTSERMTENGSLSFQRVIVIIPFDVNDFVVQWQQPCLRYCATSNERSFFSLLYLSCVVLNLLYDDEIESLITSPRLSLNV